MTAPLTWDLAASNIASGAVESSLLWRSPPRKSRGYFHARNPGIRSYGGAPGVGNAPGLSRAAFERSRHQAAVESLLCGDRNATLEAPMVTTGHDGPRCSAPISARAP